MQAIRDAKKEQAAIGQAYQQFQAQYQHLMQQLKGDPDNESLWEQLQSLSDSEDARIGVEASDREKLQKQAREGLADARERNWVTRTYQQFQDGQIRISRGYDHDPEGTLEALIAHVNSEQGLSLTAESRNALRESYQAQLKTLRAKRQARAQEQARIQNSFERVSQQVHSLLDQIKQSPDDVALIEEYLNLLDSSDAHAGLSNRYRQTAKAMGTELLDAAKTSQKNRRLYQQYQDEYTAIMATYGENPILAMEKVLALLNTSKAESLTPEIRKEQREYHQSLLNWLKAQEQAQKERLEIATQAYCSAESCSGESPTDGQLLTSVLNGLEIIGREEDPASTLINGQVELLADNLLRFSYERSPALTQVVINVLTITGGLVEAAFDLMDEATGQIVSQTWSNLDENTQYRIKGGEKVVLAVLLPLGLGKKTLEVSTHAIKAVRKQQGSAPLKNDPYHPDAVKDRRTQWREGYEHTPSHDDILELASQGGTVELFNVNNIWNRNNGLLGEELARRFSEKMGLDIRVLQNNSRHGVDLYSYDPVRNEYLVIEVKSSWAGNFKLSKLQRNGPEVYLDMQARKAAGGQGFWRPENTPPGIQDDGFEIRSRLNPKEGLPATVKGIKMEVAIPRSGESGIPNLTIREWN